MQKLFLTPSIKFHKLMQPFHPQLKKESSKVMYLTKIVVLMIVYYRLFITSILYIFGRKYFEKHFIKALTVVLGANVSYV